MKPFQIAVDSGGLPLIIIPESEAHLDGHPVLTYSYRIFKKDQAKSYVSTEQMLLPEKKLDPDYMGTIVFEHPDKLFQYVADGQKRLSPDEVQEVIELITSYREKPELWSL